MTYPLYGGSPSEKRTSAGSRTSGESTVSGHAAMCASLIRTTVIANRHRKENFNAASPAHARENTALSSRSHVDDDRSPVADVVRHQVDRRCPAAQQLRAGRESCGRIQGPHDFD